MAIYNRRSGFILIGAFLIFTACGETKTPNSISENSGSSGQELYNQYCKVCHGSAGNLGVGDAADLSQTVKTIEEKLYIITNGSESGKMTAFKGVLTEKEIDAVAKYTETLKK